MPNIKCQSERSDLLVTYRDVRNSFDVHIAPIVDGLLRQEILCFLELLRGQVQCDLLCVPTMCMNEIAVLLISPPGSHSMSGSKVGWQGSWAAWELGHPGAWAPGT